MLLKLIHQIWEARQIFSFIVLYVPNGQNIAILTRRPNTTHYTWVDCKNAENFDEIYPTNNSWFLLYLEKVIIIFLCVCMNQTYLQMTFKIRIIHKRTLKSLVIKSGDTFKFKEYFDPKCWLRFSHSKNNTFTFLTAFN